MLHETTSVKKPGEKALAVEKCMDELRLFKEPLPLALTPKIKTKKVLDEDSYIRVIWL
jgi:hypothetical protein